MGSINFKKDDIIFRKGTKLNQICIIVNGTVDIYSKYYKLSVESGTMIGLSDIYSREYLFDYVAANDVTLYAYTYNNLDDLEKIIVTNPDISGLLVASIFKLLSSHLSQYTNLRKSCAFVFKYLFDCYGDYKSLCTNNDFIVKSLPILEDFEPFSQNEYIDKWIINYYDKLNALPNDTKKSFYTNDPSICIGTILEACKNLLKVLELCNEMADYMSEASDIFINIKGIDLLGLYTSLSLKTHKLELNANVIDTKLKLLLSYMKNNYFINSTLLKSRISSYEKKLSNIEYYIDDEVSAKMGINSNKDADEYVLKNEDSEEDFEECLEEVFEEELSATDSLEQQIRLDIKDSLNKILAYAQIDSEKKEHFKELITVYKKIPDKNSSDLKIRALRKELTDNFYEIYEKAAELSFCDFALHPVIKMFFYFGYMDEELAGKNNAVELYKIATSMYPDPNGRVFTLYDWLKKIYMGEKEPSKNELDIDYDAYLRDLERKGEISDKEASGLSSDSIKKFKYEMHNVVRTTNKTTFGRITTFCPIFSEHNVIRKLENCYIDYNVVKKNLAKIKNIDYSAFYREISYSDKDNKIPTIYIQKEIMPEVILMPNIGSRGIMWQEYSGHQRNTPSRMMISIFNTEDINDVFTKMVGELRWELCKRVQGVRWNDVTDPSLTSEYNDYIQFYKKNHSLSTEAKEKIKSQLQKCRNSTKEMFVRDYYTWIKYESTGSPRLNKVARGILFTYCPFNKEFRDIISTNAMYKDLLEKYEIRQSKLARSVDFLFARLIKDGATITPELEEHKNFYTKREF